MLGVAALGIAAIAAIASVGPEGPPDRSWRDGPARLLLSDSEYARYGRLRTDEARAAFVERFWRRLDPDPTTDANEFRERYAERCREAARRFSDGRAAAWQTDRGRVFLILGEPGTIERLPGDPRSISREAWTYALPSHAELLRVVFYKGNDGVFRIDPNGVADGRPDRDLRDRRLLVDRLRYTNPSISRLRSASIIDASLRGVLGIEPPSEESRAWPGTSRVREPEGVSPDSPGEAGRVEDDTFYFQAADGSVLALLVLTVRAGSGEGFESPPYQAVATVWAPGGVAAGGAPRTVPLAPYPAELGEETNAFVGRIHLEPGTSQRIRYAVADSTRRTLLLRNTRIEAPELGTGGFSSSSLVPAERYGPASEDGGPFQVGSEEIVPRPDPRFRRGEPLRLYLQVYEAALHAETYRASVDLVFHFERLDGKRWRRHGKPLEVRGAHGASLGLALPIGDWPTGRYRVEVVLEDRVASERTTAVASFSVTD